MQLLANENIPNSAVQALRAVGHDVLWVRSEFPGASDIDILARAGAESRLLITFDKDFGELVFRHGLPAPSGVVLFRVRLPSPEQVAQFVVNALAAPVEWAGHFAVVEADRVRLVPLPKSTGGP